MSTKKSVEKKSKQSIAKKKVAKKPSQYSTRRIPQTKLEEALEVLKDEKQLSDILKQSSSCRPPIHLAAENQTISRTLILQLKDVQNCLMKRDWLNLAKLLSLIDPSSHTHYGVFIGLTAKYATMLLAYHDKKLLAMLSQSVLVENDHEALLRKQIVYP